MIIDINAVRVVAQQEFRIDIVNSEILYERLFRSVFGIPSVRCVALWNHLSQQTLLPTNAKVKYLLWTLLHLKIYGPIRAMSQLCSTSERTYHKWVQKFLEGISRLDLIKWENRFSNTIGCTCLISVDGTDFRIQEPTPFNRAWYSHKFKGPGVRYEVAICIRTGYIVHISGPWQCGRWSDIRIAREGLQTKMLYGEKYVADGGYRDGGEYGNTPSGRNNAYETMKDKVRSRHEQINGRFKVFQVLKQVFRGSPETHELVFTAVANITQLGIQGDSPAPQVVYDDREYE